METSKETKNPLSKSNIAINLYDNFNIDTKQLIIKISVCSVKFICVLDDGRLVSVSGSHTIIIYNKITYKPDIIITIENIKIICILNLNSNMLAIGTFNEIKLFKIKNKNYEIVQTFSVDCVNKIIELKNKNLVVCSKNNFNFYYKDNNNDKYKKEYGILPEGLYKNVIQTKENEICYSEYFTGDGLDDKSFITNFSYINKYTICFYDLKEGQIKAKMSIKNYGILNMIIIIDLLIIGSSNNIFMINVNQYKIIRLIKIRDIPHSICVLNENMFLTGNNDGSISQWIIKDDNIDLFSKKENAHNNNKIIALIKIGKGKIASCSNSFIFGDDNIKIW